MKTYLFCKYVDDRILFMNHDIEKAPCKRNDGGRVCYLRAGTLRVYITDRLQRLVRLCYDLIPTTAIQEIGSNLYTNQTRLQQTPNYVHTREYIGISTSPLNHNLSKLRLRRKASYCCHGLSKSICKLISCGSEPNIKPLIWYSFSETSICLVQAWKNMICWQISGTKIVTP